LSVLGLNQAFVLVRVSPHGFHFQVGSGDHLRQSVDLLLVLGHLVQVFNDLFLLMDNPRHRFGLDFQLLDLKKPQSERIFESRDVFDVVVVLQRVPHVVNFFLQPEEAALSGHYLRVLGVDFLMEPLFHGNLRLPLLLDSPDLEFHFDYDLLEFVFQTVVHCLQLGDALFQQTLVFVG